MFDLLAQERAWRIAHSLKELIGRQPMLLHREVLAHVLAIGGMEFIYLNKNGNQAIKPMVLYRFRKLTEETVVWNWHAICWRRRRPSDPPDRRRVG